MRERGVVCGIACSGEGQGQSGVNELKLESLKSLYRDQIHRHSESRQQSDKYNTVAGWRGVVVVTALVSINQVNQRRARLVLRWVTVCGRINPLSKIELCGENDLAM